MNNYESLLIDYENCEIDFKEVDFQCNKEIGYYNNNKILVNTQISNKQKYGVLAEELGHHFTTVGDIKKLDNTNNKKQELKARRWGHKKIVSLDSIIEAFDNNCLNKYEIAEYLGVTDKYFEECIQDYKNMYGTEVCKIGKYHIIFEPSLGIYQKF